LDGRLSPKRGDGAGSRVEGMTQRTRHGALSHKPPIARLNELNNLLWSDKPQRIGTL